MVPYLWVKVEIVVPDNFALLIKLALMSTNIGLWLGYSLVFISLIVFLLGVYLELKMRNISPFPQSQKIRLETDD